MVDQIPALPPTPRGTPPIQRRGGVGADRGRSRFDQAMQQGEHLEAEAEAGAEEHAGGPLHPAPAGRHHEPGEPGSTIDLVV